MPTIPTWGTNLHRDLTSMDMYPATATTACSFEGPFRRVHAIRVKCAYCGGTVADSKGRCDGCGASKEAN